MSAGAKSGKGSSGILRMSLAVAGLVACTGSWAQFAQTDISVLPSLAEQTARLEVNTSNTVRFDAEAPGTSQRVDLMLLPPRRSAGGLAVGMTGYNAPASVTGAGLVPSSQPTVDVGVHVRHTLDNNHRVDLTAWRRLPQADVPLIVQDRQATFGARVEMNLSPTTAKKEFASDKGFIGMQLDNGGRISIRRKHGGPMIYYRNTF